MKNMRLPMYGVLVVSLLTGWGLTGCAPDVGLQLIASPEKLDFGADKDKLVLKVTKNYTGATMEPLVVTADKPWVMLEECVSPAQNCVSNGPLDAIRIPVQIDRNLLALGLNAATLHISAGKAAPVKVEVLVDEILQADFSAKQQQVSFGRPVEFMDASLVGQGAGAVEKWLWDFGDGAISTQPNPFHLYAKPGEYDVSLTITTTEKITRKAFKPAFIKVDDVSAVVNFIASKTNVDINDEIVFTDLSNVENTPILSRLWSFGDGKTSSALTPRYKYAAPGLYTVSLKISTSAGEFTETKTNYIVVRSSEGPRANFVYDTGSRTTPYVGENVQFYDLSEPGSGAIIAYAWDFGDQTPVVTERNPLHRYVAKGEYTVKLTVTSPYGSSTREGVILVTFRPPVADFDAYPSRQFVDQPIQFFDLTEPGYSDVASWLWQFGDGYTSTERNPQHAYARAGVYSVTLHVVGGDPDSTQSSKTKTDFVTVVQPPVPAFTWMPRLIIRNQRVTFDASSTVIADEPIIRYSWDFGGGVTRQGLTVNHRFTAAGTFPVKLTVRTETSEISTTRNVVVDQPPNAVFSADPLIGTSGVTEIKFTLGAQPANARPITRYFWEFGDNDISYDPQPIHVYQKPGIYTVRFTARYRHSQSLSSDPDLSIATERAGYITIQGLVGPSGTVTADRDLAFVNAPVTFSVTTVSPSAPITSYLWDFGDGTTQLMATPVSVMHTYTAPGTYAVKVTLEAAALQPPYRTGVATMKTPLPVVQGSDLDRYVSLDDGCFEYAPPTTQLIQMGGLTVARAYKIYRMTSQCWNPDDAVHEDYIAWTHPMVVVVPEYRTNNTGMLFIDGGSRNSTDQVEEMLWQVAVLTGSPVVHVKNIPSQPIVFKDEVIPAGSEDNHTGQDIILRSRTEDSIIAYTYDKYLQSYRETNGNPNKDWPLLFPMAKAAVKAMDVAEEVLENAGVYLDGFVVTGASKRGWTTWMTAAIGSAVERRVRGIAPIVINVLNMDEHLTHHRASYGYWSPAIYDYAQEGVFDQLIPGEGSTTVTPEAQSLLNCVDPYEYALQGKYASMPKFMLNATGDEFFIPDTTNLYYNGLQGEKHLSYVPNVGHGMGDFGAGTSLTNPTNPVAMLLAWYMSVSQNQPLPQVNFSFESNGNIRVEVNSAVAPSSVRVWRANSPVGLRDFRDYVVNDAWTSTNLAAQSPGVYVATAPTVPAGRYVAYFVQLQFPNSAVFPTALQTYLQTLGYSVPDIMVSSGVRVLPNAYPEFTGYMANTLRPDAVPFPTSKLPVAVVYGTPREMGYYYGQVMAASINAFIPAYINTYTTATTTSREQLLGAWVGDEKLLDPRILEEIQGIASAPGITVSLEDLQVAHAAALRDNAAAFTAASTLAYKSVQADANSAHAVTLNAPLSRNLHQYYQCAVLYIPDQGAPHTLFTCAGLAIGRTGINLGGISAVEIMDGATQTDFAPNGMGVMREILYDAFRLRDGVSIMKQTPLERNVTLLIGDGRNEIRGALLRIDPSGQVLVERYDFANSDFGLNTRGILYAAKSSVETQLRSQISTLLPTLTLTELQDLSRNTAFAESGRNILNVVYNSDWLTLSVATAQGSQEAFRNSYATLDMQSLLP